MGQGARIARTLFGQKARPELVQLADAERPYTLATIKLGELVRTRQTINADALQLMQRAQGPVAILARINAAACASQTARLYRKARKVGTRGTKAVGTASRRYMASGKAGVKAAEFAESASDIVEVTSGPLLELLTRPNPLQSAAAYDQQQFFYMEITGDAYEYVADGAVLPLAPHWTVPLPDVNDYLTGYAYGRERTRVIEIDANDVVQHRLGAHPDDPFRGYGSLRDVLTEADVLLRNTAFDNELAERGNLPGVFVTVEGEGSGTGDEAKLSNLKDRFISEMNNSANQLRAFFARKVNFAFPPMNNQHLQRSETLDRHLQSLLASFGIPESMWKLNAANLASSQSGYDRQYLDLTVRSRINQYAAMRTEILFPRLGFDPSEFQLIYDDPTPHDEERVVQVLVPQVVNGIRTINEARDELGLPPIAGGDELRFSGVAAGDMVGAFGAAPSLPPMFGGQPSAPEASASRPMEEAALNGAQIQQLVSIVERVSTGVISRDAGLAIASASFPGVPLDKLEAIFAELVEGSVQADASEALKAFRRRFRVRITGAAPARKGGFYSLEDCACSAIHTKEADRGDPALDIAGALRAEDTITADLLELFRRYAPAAAQVAARSGVVDLSAMDAEMARALFPTLEGALNAGADAAANSFVEATGAIDAAFEVVPQSAIDRFEGSLLGRVRDIGADMEQQVSRAVTEGLRDGQTIEEIADRLTTEGGFTEARARRIARTEVAEALQTGKIERAKVMGIKRKRLKNAPGPSAVHKAIADRTANGIPLEDPFVRAGETVRAGGESETYDRDRVHTPLRPNCRCDVDLIFEDLLEELGIE